MDFTTWSFTGSSPRILSGIAPNKRGEETLKVPSQHSKGNPIGNAACWGLRGGSPPQAPSLIGPHAETPAPAARPPGPGWGECTGLACSTTPALHMLRALLYGPGDS